MGCLEYTYKNVYQEMMKNEKIMCLNSFKQENILKLMDLFKMWMKIKKYSNLDFKFEPELLK